MGRTEEALMWGGRGKKRQQTEGWNRINISICLKEVPA